MQSKVCLFWRRAHGIELSDVAQLINIFRSKLKNKPLSQILKEKELLKESLIECKFFMFEEVDSLKVASVKKKSLAKQITEMKQYLDSQKIKKTTLNQESENSALKEDSKLKSQKNLQLAENQVFYYY